MKEAQIFPPAANTLAVASLFFALALVVGTAVALGLVARSPYYTRVGEAIEQPVPFSHAHHVGGLGIDCRYCHTTVENSPNAGVPATETCMTCHSQIWKDAPMLQPVRDSYYQNKPIRWNRVHDLPDFVYFNHSVHVNRGVACRECHGEVDQMPLIAKQETLFMRWCLDCHRHPETALVAPASVFDPQPPERREIHSWLQMKSGNRLAKSPPEKGATPLANTITDCTACHR